MVFHKHYNALLENYTNIKGPIPSFGTNERDKSKRDGYIWSMPPEGWYKDNFDGATKGNPRKASVGGVIRNTFGKGIVLLVAPLGTQTNHYVEAIVDHYTIK